MSSLRIFLYAVATIDEAAARVREFVNVAVSVMQSSISLIATNLMGALGHVPSWKTGQRMALSPKRWAAARRDLVRGF